MTNDPRLVALVGAHLSCEEDDETRRVMTQLRPARVRGRLTPAELESVCLWKSPRAIHHVRANSARTVAAVTRAALASHDERVRMATLTTLRGVSVPMASALLTLVFPRSYAVIDIRVWQLLHAEGAVHANPAGRGLTVEQWCEFLTTVRAIAQGLRRTPRAVERTLFELHRQRQAGRLYA